ncbi:MAG: hypothetical protein Q4A74_03275, partial [Cardiobacteriaceae bacterium]|nr:hypothetical protein [Cardiobacteriaceae bacterium]
FFLSKRRGIVQILGGSGMMMQENEQKTGSFVLKNECVDELEGFAQVSNSQKPIQYSLHAISLLLRFRCLNEYYCNDNYHE